MNPCLLMSPVVDTLSYPSRLMTMGDFPEPDQWLTPDSTPYTTFADFTSVTQNTLPAAPAFEHQGSSYPQSWHSPQALSSGDRDFVYNVVAGASGGTASGLGITDSVQYSPLASTVSQASYVGSGFFSQAPTSLQSGLPPTPQTGGLPPEGSSAFRPQQSSPGVPQTSGSRQPRQHKRIRPKGGDEEPILKRRRSSSTSQTSQPYPYPQVIQPEARAEMERKKEFFEGLRNKGVPWKDIVKQYEVEYGKSMSQAALQMERKRVKDSLRVWTKVDVKALESAHDYWETHKFSIIAEKMQDFGAEENWSPKQCQKKWEEMFQGVQEAAALTPIPQPIPLRRAPTLAAPERWMQQGYDTTSASSRVSPVSATNTISPSPWANTPLSSDTYGSYQ